MNLLITGAWKQAQDHQQELETLGHKIHYLPQESQENLPCPHDWVEGVIANNIFQYHPIETFPNLRYIQLTSAGLDRAPLDYIQEHDIELHNAKGVYSVPMAEFAIAGVLQLYKQSRALNSSQTQHKWEKQRNLRELNGKTILILGCGDVGQECAKRFQAFGCRVIGLNRTPRNLPNFEAIYPLEALSEYLPQADILILSVALTDRTTHILDAQSFSQMKPDAVLVSLARGQLVDENALITWLQTNPNSAAVLDVFEQEPLPSTNLLWNLSNVLLTPHNSFAGEGNAERLENCILKNIGKYTHE